jgi:competence protein CoiA
LIRCIKKETHKALYASQSEEDAIRKLSRRNELLCPNCHNLVLYKKGKKIRAHFAHKPDTECVVTNYEKETEEHIKGKEILFSWLKNKFPDAHVELEVYIPETRQIADLLITHVTGVKWALEFQRSPLSPDDWKQRHEGYKSAHILDFWILEKEHYLKFSTAKGEENARLRKELEKTIFQETGFCYFLDLNTSVLTIDFSFYTKTKYVEVRGRRNRVKSEYIYHNPNQHSSELKDIEFKYNDEYIYGFMEFDAISKGIREKANQKLASIKYEERRKKFEEVTNRANTKLAFAKKTYPKEYFETAKSFMQSNGEMDFYDLPEEITKFQEDIYELSEEQFFEKYEHYLRKIEKNREEMKALKESENIKHQILTRLTYGSTSSSIHILDQQAELPLEGLLLQKYEIELDIILYVLNQYEETLDKLVQYNPHAVKERFKEVKGVSAPYEERPTKLDYAYAFKYKKTKEEVDKIMVEVQEKVIDDIEKPIDWSDWL